MFKLVIADDEGKTTVVPLVRDEITIGRREGNTIRLTERNISRKHAKLRKVDGSYVVEDLSSYNGVKVNGRRIGGEIAIKAGDQIAIGDYQLALQVEGAAHPGGGALPGGALPGDGVTLTDTTAPMAMPGGGYAQEPSTAMIQAPGAATIPMAPAVSPAVAPAPAPRPPARLVMTSPPAPGAEFALARPVTRLGRAEELDVWVNHRSISREHAEITNDGGTLRIRDLGSANGVRVNGRDISQAELKPGDVVELGQVRFRFVAPGETFVFEADRTMQLDAISAPERSGSRAPLIVAAAIVGVAVIGAVAVALSGGESPSATELPSDPGVQVTTASDPQAAPPAAVPDGAMLDQQVAVAVGACRTAITSGDFATAISRADQALTLRADDPQAAACRADAEQARLESDAFARGEALRRGGDIEGAFVAFAELPDGSPYRGRPEVRDTNREFATLQIARADELLASSPEEALSHAQNALLVPGLDPRLRAQADAIVRRARVRGGSAASPRDRTPRPRTEVRPTPTSHPTPVTEVRPTPPVSTGPGAGGDAESGTPMQAAQACLARGDNRCVITALEGRARTSPEMRLLIETYRAMGNSPRMLDTMARFVQRFPSDPRAGQYRQILAQQGR